MNPKPPRDPSWPPLQTPEHRQDRLRRRLAQGGKVTDWKLAMPDDEFDKLCDLENAHAVTT